VFFDNRSFISARPVRAAEAVRLRSRLDGIPRMSATVFLGRSRLAFFRGAAARRGAVFWAAAFGAGDFWAADFLDEAFFGAAFAFVAGRVVAARLAAGAAFLAGLAAFFAFWVRLTGGFFAAFIIGLLADLFAAGLAAAFFFALFADFLRAMTLILSNSRCALCGALRKR